jgi:hypothetical protein
MTNNQEYIIGISHIETMKGKMILRAIEDENRMSKPYTNLNYDCYTYGNGNAYYWTMANKKELKLFNN